MSPIPGSCEPTSKVSQVSRVYEMHMRRGLLDELILQLRNPLDASVRRGPQVRRASCIGSRPQHGALGRTCSRCYGLMGFGMLMRLQRWQTFSLGPLPRPYHEDAATYNASDSLRSYLHSISAARRNLSSLGIRLSNALTF